jgi:hemerythrin-like domain-containing protein
MPLEKAAVLACSGRLPEAMALLQELLPFPEGEQQVHFRQEEEGLFLYLARVTGEGPLRAMVEEHQSYEKVLAALKGLMGRPADGGDLGKLLEHLAAMLRGHIHKEETAYLPLAEEKLEPEKLREVDEEMEAIGRLGTGAA